MGFSTKILPVIALGTLLSGCSMAGTGDFFADEYAALQRQQMPNHYGAPVTKAETTKAAENHCQPAYACQAPQYGQATTPDAHAYGASVRGHGGYVPSAHGAAPYGLRGAAPAFKAHTYGTLGVVNYEAGEDLYGAQGRFGYQLNKYFGAEIEGSLGLSKDSKDTVIGAATLRQSISVENSAAAFGVLRYPLIGKLSGYSRLGYHQTELDEKITDGTSVLIDREYSTHGIAYGSGFEYAVNPRTAVRLDYTVYDYEGPDADSVSLAIARKF